jgi:hypothetical protein
VAFRDVLFCFVGKNLNSYFCLEYTSCSLNLFYGYGCSDETEENDEDENEENEGI